MKILSWNQKDQDEPASLYRIDIPEDGARFFQDLNSNAEMDGREKFQLIEMSDADWKLAEVAGNIEA